jgi:hypothetical protein
LVERAGDRPSSASPGAPGSDVAQTVSRVLRFRFMAICIVPVAASVGPFLGGAWNWLGAATYVGLYLIWDALGPRDASPPLARGGGLLDALLFVQVPLLLLAWLGFLVTFSGTGGGLLAANGWIGPDAFGPRAKMTALNLVGACLSLALAISVAGTVTAHELVHRTRSRISLLAGRILLAFIFDAAFSIEHVHGHHARVATAEDPATARRGETLYHW